jgi:hypothetical protein
MAKITLRQRNALLSTPAPLPALSLHETTQTHREPLPDYPSFQLKQPSHGLFGEVVITDDDLFNWLAAISPIPLHERGYAAG